MVVNDLGFAAYLLSIKQCELKNTPEIDPSGKFMIDIDIDEKTLQKYEWSYLSSDFKKFDNTLKFLKRALKRT
ncbi:MAG: hypothetical protein GXO10_02925 [Crenarchaeota archaeon]|nr:hypothetical protein [Thermoproteota archaeon]